MRERALSPNVQQENYSLEIWVMTLLQTLQTDHRQVKELLETILSTDDAKKRGDLFKQFRTELTAHSRAEEKVLYRGMEKSEEGKDDALEGAVEHEVVDRLMEDLSRSRSIGSDTWTARCTVLQELLEHHIDEEEGEFFKIARKIFDRETLAKMGMAFTAEKTKLASAMT
jgi:hemerythrin-like domain-containing protein